MKIKEQILLIAYACFLYIGLSITFKYLGIIKLSVVEYYWPGNWWLSILLILVFATMELLIYRWILQKSGKIMLVVSIGIIYFLIFNLYNKQNLVTTDFFYYLLAINLKNTIICYSVYYSEQIMLERKEEKLLK